MKGTAPTSVRLTPEAVERIRLMLDTYGEPQTVQHFGLSRNALFRAMSRLPIRRGTAAVIADRIEKPLGSPDP